jgi:hypothetical protein
MITYQRLKSLIKYFFATIIILQLVSCGGVDNTTSLDLNNEKSHMESENNVVSLDTVKPYIVLNGNQNINIQIGNRYIEYGAKVHDNVDGDISNNLKIDAKSVNTKKIGRYRVTYNAKDLSGNSAEEKIRVVNIVEKVKKDIEAPVIKLNGDETVTLTVGDDYEELGATAYDNVDGDITDDIVIDSSKVDTNSEGNYSVTYNVVDQAGNSAIEVTRIVIVKNSSSGQISKPWDYGRLIVDGYMVKHSDGTGFFFMADTAWKLAQKLDKEDVDLYLSDRKKKGFNVVLTTVAEHTGIRSHDTLELAFNNSSWREPNEKYWEHIDYIIDKAEENGLYIGLLPAWQKQSEKSLISTDEAKDYGEFISNRYKDKENIIWVMGGDSNLNSEDKEGQKEVWSALANAIRDVVEDKHLITFHPSGAVSSSSWFHDAQWLDFHMIQSGHCAPMKNGVATIKKDYNLENYKPTLDAEARYETIEECFYKSDRTGDRFNAKDVREMAYKQIFSGAFGHTYGHHSIWQMSPEKNLSPIGGIDATVNSWKEALEAEGAIQMEYIVKLMKSRDILSRVPDQSIIKSSNDAYATRGDGYIFVYLPEGGSITINMGKISGERVKAWWYSPTTGDATEIGVYKNSGTQLFSSDTEDKVLIVDDVSKGYKKP